MKKHYKLFICLAFLIIAAVIVYFKFYKVDETLNFEEAYPFSEDLACVKINGKYGYINKAGEIVIDPIYDNFSFFYCGFTIQLKDGLYGCLDTNGNVVIPFEYEELILSDPNYFSAKKDGRYGCLTIGNEIAVDFISYQPIYVYIYSNDHAVALIYNEVSKQGFIDLNTGFKVEPIYDSISPWGSTENIVSISLGMKYGFINLDTKTIIEPIYSQNIYFHEGLAVASENLKSGYIDLSGNYVIEPIYEDAGPFFEGLAFVKIDGKYGYINTKGEIVIKPSFAHGSTFTEGVVQVVIDENSFETIYINTSGDIVDASEYYKAFVSTYTEYYPEATIIPTYYKNEELGLRAMAINKNGEILFKTVYNDIFSFQHNMATVMLGEKVGCINEKGIEILPPIYEEIQIIDEKHLLLKENSKYGIIDILRNEVLPIKYDDIKTANSSLILIKLANKWGTYNLETKELKENIYDDVYSNSDFPFLDFPIPVQKNEKWFYIDENGDILF